MHPETAVFIVDDDRSVQMALKRLLKANGLEGHSFSSATEFLERGLAPGVTGCLVLDLKMPGMSGVDLQAELLRRGIHLPIIFITGHGSIPTSVQVMKSGAIDFLEKPFDPQRLLDIIRGGLALSLRLSEDENQCLEIAQRFELLSPRECDVFRLVVKGLLNKEIAFELGIVEKTVKVHRARIMEKMQVNSLAELVSLAERFRLPPCSRSSKPSP